MSTNITESEILAEIERLSKADAVNPDGFVSTEKICQFMHWGDKRARAFIKQMISEDKWECRIFKTMGIDGTFRNRPHYGPKVKITGRKQRP